VSTQFILLPNKFILNLSEHESATTHTTEIAPEHTENLMIDKFPSINNPMPA
jgi:hypothetical protein